MKRRRQAIKRRTPKRIKERSYKKLYKEVQEQVEVVNRRLESLERYHKTGTWSIGKLIKRVKSNKTKNLLYKGKRIKLKPTMTKTDLTAIQKATRQFLESATSTNKGIERVKTDTIEQLKDTINLEKRRKGKILISDKDAEDMYNMLANKDFNRFNISKKGREDEFIGASAMWSEIDYASTNNISKDDFIERLQNLRRQDFSVDDRKAAERIYNNYVL